MVHNLLGLPEPIRAIADAGGGDKGAGGADTVAAGGGADTVSGGGDGKGAAGAKAAADAKAQAAAAAAQPFALDTKLDPKIFSADVQKQLSLQKIETGQGLVDWAMSLQKIVGVDRLPKPPSGQLSKYYGEHKEDFGVPKTGDDYKIDKPDLPKGLEWDADWEKEVRKFAIDRNVPQEQFKDLSEIVIKGQMRLYDQMQKASEKETADLQTAIKTEWGANADKNVEIAQFAARKLGLDQPILDQLNKELTAPGLVKLMAKIGAGMAGAELITGDGRSSGGGAFEAQGELEQLRADPAWSKALHTRGDPGHDRAVQQQEELMKRGAK